MQEVLDRLGVSKIRITPLTLAVKWNCGMLREDYPGECARCFILANGTGKRGYLPAAGIPCINPLHQQHDAYQQGVRAGVHLPCDQLFGSPPDKEAETTDYAAKFVKWLHNIQLFARQFLKVVSEPMKPRCIQLAN